MRTIQAKIGDILFYDWNPIGDHDIPKDEYDSYVSEIFNLIQSGADAELLAVYLLRIESTIIGMPGTIENCRLIAKKILSL